MSTPFVRSFRSPGPTSTVRLVAALFLSCTLVAACGQQPQQPAGDAGASMEPQTIEVEWVTHVHLVRHAETPRPPYETSPPDPHLTEAGVERAAALAERLAEEPIETVFSTDYHRTRETAAAVAEAHGLEVTIYDPSDLQAFAEQLRGMPGHHVVIGHSNTTPMLVDALGGASGEPIADEWEFDRYYVVALGDNGAISTAQTTYGAPSEPPAEEGEGQD